MVYLCNSIAAASPLVSAEVIDAEAFPDLVARFNVGTVPRVLINDTVQLSGIIPAAELLAKITAAAQAGP